ncbi:DUF3099 domain-containing protein [Nocardiopsis sp. HNM0947]|uniref:DUF3099 domain-containing protein n=1 Tax=Nocardiopsis coralli TaxID=2772213 RepID=A0ABR9P9F0_9ACTN|nr:DUF3099 domain-containing protein [Nocardiopsis coralli]MBE3000466.1 DUF3099 domain-containing protein [Nocardiopsis coralli]
MKRRVRQYSLVMGVCVLLFAASAPVYFLFGTGWAVAMCVVASVLPPVAMTLGNLADPDDPRDHDAVYGPNAEPRDEDHPEGPAPR